MPRMSATPRLSTTRVSTRHGRLGFAAGAAAAAVSSPPALAAGISQRHWPSHVPTRLPVPAEFYQTLLREFLEGSAEAGGGNWNTVRVLAAAPTPFGRRPHCTGSTLQACAACRPHALLIIGQLHCLPSPYCAPLTMLTRPPTCLPAPCRLPAGPQAAQGRRPAGLQGPQAALPRA